MRVCWAILVAAPLLLTLVVSPRAQNGDGETLTELTTLQESYWELLQNQNLISWMALFADEYRSWSGRESQDRQWLMEGTRNSLGDIQPGSFRFRRAEQMVTPLVDVVLVQYACAWTAVTKAGRHVSGRGRYSHVWRRSGDQWTIVRDAGPPFRDVWLASNPRDEEG
jgi:ABC-type transport system involved in cytochrome bd biosynthesis fused ATPase/permease subunit